jgi:hypothetical protein
MADHGLKVNTVGDLGFSQIASAEITGNTEVGCVRSSIRHSV